LGADQSIASAVSGGSFADILAAQFEALTPDAQLVGDSFQSLPTEWIGSLFGAGSSATEAASDLASSLDPATVVDPSIFADVLSSIGL
jgi:hypothetical protein